MTTCWREQVMSAVLAAFTTEMQSTFGSATKVLRELPPDNPSNISDAATGWFIELDGTKPILAGDNSPIIAYELAPVMLLCLLKSAEGETSLLPPQAAEFEAAVKRVLRTAITVSGITVRVMASGAYGRSVGRNQMWVDVPVDVVIKGKP